MEVGEAGRPGELVQQRVAAAHRTGAVPVPTPHRSTAAQTVPEVAQTGRAVIQTHVQVSTCQPSSTFYSLSLFSFKLQTLKFIFWSVTVHVESVQTCNRSLIFFQRI